LPYRSSLDIVRILRMEWRVVYYHGLAAFGEQAASGRFLPVPMDAASQETEWILSRQT
jgi:hypothetical protein